MAYVAVTSKVQASADDVWGVIGGFHTLPTWHPAVERSDAELDGNDILRRLTLADGGFVLERLESFDNEGRSYTYSILDGVMPVENYVAGIRVLDDDNGESAIVQWTARFDPTGDEAEIVDLVANGVFRVGFAALEERFTG